MLATVLALSVAASADEVAIRATFVRWKQLVKDTKSLAVEFTLTRHDRASERKEVFDCNLTLLRTDTDVLAKLITRERATKETFECVLRGGGYHLPNPTEKSLLVYKPESVLPTAAGFFSPLLTALWVEKPEALFSLKVSLREKFYTHLDYNPKTNDGKAEAERGRVVVVHWANDTIRIGAPRQLWHDLPGGQKRVTLDVRKWELDGKNPPKVDDFNVPTEKDGWKVTVTEGFWKDFQKRRTDK